MAKKSLRTCPNGHRYEKSSNCPTCPHCEAGKKPQEGFLSQLAAPARRALASRGIHTLEQLAGYSEKEILSLHGIGPSSLPILKAALRAGGRNFKQNSATTE